MGFKLRLNDVSFGNLFQQLTTGIAVCMVGIVNLSIITLLQVLIAVVEAIIAAFIVTQTCTAVDSTTMS
jgi:hypothetical protein